jgi:hypothetical protein
MDKISNSNIKLILEYFFKNKNVITLMDLYDFYKPNQGFLYCLHNEIFKFYGDDLYKCGNSIDTDKRLCQYTTSYPMPSEILLTSDSFFDKSFAETLLFYYLKDFKFKPNREFIKCDFKIIENAFHKVKQFFSIYNTKQLLIDFLIIDDNFKTFFTKLYNNLSDEDKFTKNISKIEDILDILNLNNIQFRNETEFIDYISKYLFQLNYNKFNDIFKSKYNNFGKYRYLLDNINNLFWLENKISIQRLQINDINENINFDNILDEFINNIDNFVSFFKGCESKNKTINVINKKINKIKKIKPSFKYSHFQKFIADCYNQIINDSIAIINKEIRNKKTYVGISYLFKYSII